MEIRPQLEQFEEVNHKYVNLQTCSEKEPSYGTTNIIRLLDEGFIFVVDSRLTNDQQKVVTDNATKFRLITPKVASLMSGEFGVATTVWDRLSDWVRERQIQGLSEPSVFRIARHARDYMTSLASSHPCTLLIAGYQYKDNNSLVPYIYKVEYTPIKGAHIEKQGKITVVGSGQIYAKQVLDRLCTEDMTVKQAIAAVNWAMLDASLFDSCTGGISRVYFLSMTCQSLPAYHTCEMYLRKFGAYHIMNRRSIYVFCPVLADRVDTYLQQKFSKYGLLRCVHSLGKMRAINFHLGECDFHRVEFAAEESVDYAYRDSIAEPDNYRRIYIDGLNGYSFYVIFCIASQQELERIRGQLICAIAMFNAHRNRKGKAAVIWKNLSGIPSQPNDKECGYFVMRFMKDIIEDRDLSFATKWERKGKTVYGQEDIDEARNELANYVVTHHL